MGMLESNFNDNDYQLYVAITGIQVVFIPWANALMEAIVHDLENFKRGFNRWKNSAVSIFNHDNGNGTSWRGVVLRFSFEGSEKPDEEINCIVESCNKYCSGLHKMKFSAEDEISATYFLQ